MCFVWGLVRVLELMALKSKLLDNTSNAMIPIAVRMDITVLNKCDNSLWNKTNS